MGSHLAASPSISQIYTLARGALIGLMLFTTSVGHAFAQADRQTSADVKAATGEFAQRLDEVKKSLTELQKKIDVTRKAVNTTGEQSRKQIEELRNLVIPLLDKVADNGEVSELGAKALNNARMKLKSFEGAPGFTPGQRGRLIETWKSLVARTEQATKDLDDARKRVADLLRFLQNNDDFIAEMIIAADQEKVLEAIRDLTQALNGASDSIGNLIDSMSIPGF